MIDRARVIGAVLVPQYTTIYDRTAPLLLLLNRKGRPLLRLTGQVFDAPDLFTFAERYGLAGFEVISGEVGPKVVGARHRKALSLIERRPLLVVLLGAFVLLVLVVIGVSIFDPVND